MELMKEIEIEIYSFNFAIHFDDESFVSKTGGEPLNWQSFVTRGTAVDVRVYAENEWGNIYDPRFLQCLSHECNHAAMHILGFSGVNFDFENQETLCYLQDLLFRKSYEFAQECFDKTTGAAN